jgi:isopentenyldiphosphate isomerase
MTGNEEWFDIYDQEMNRIGQAPRSEVHRHGYWHQSFHCWILRGDSRSRKLLIQERHPDKDTYPGLFDISCAGHLSAGESVEDGARELQEELGLQVDFGSLMKVGIYSSEKVIHERLIDRELCHVFLYLCEQSLLDYKLQIDEVTGLYEVSAEEIRQLLNDDLTEMIASGVHLAADGSLVEDHRTIYKKDIVPHDSDYFDLLFRAIEELQ